MANSGGEIGTMNCLDESESEEGAAQVDTKGISGSTHPPSGGGTALKSARKKGLPKGASKVPRVPQAQNRPLHMMIY